MASLKESRKDIEQDFRGWLGGRGLSSMRSNTPNRGGSDAYAEVIDNRFSLVSVPDVITNRVDASISMLAGKAQVDAASGPLPYDDAFVLLVRLEKCTPYQLWIDGKFSLSGELQSGSSSIFDLRTRPYASGVQQFKHMHFYLSKTFLDTMADEAGEATAPEIVVPETFAFNDPAIYHLARGLLPSFQKQQHATPMFVDHLMNAAASHFISAYGVNSRRHRNWIPSMSSEQLRRVMDLMDARIHGNITLGELARESGLRPHEFKLLFKRQTGMSALAWLARRRMEKAVLHLRETNRSMEEVAALSGYANARHMADAFIKMLGNPPEVFRGKRMTYSFLRQ